MDVISLEDLDNWADVDSSMIVGVGTLGDDLLVKFKNGDFYLYVGLSNEYNSLVSSESVGKYFHADIRNSGAEFSKVEVEE